MMTLKELKQKRKLLRIGMKWSESEGRVLECGKYHTKKAMLNLKDKELVNKTIKLSESLAYIANRCRELKLKYGSLGGINWNDPYR